MRHSKVNTMGLGGCRSTGHVWAFGMFRVEFRVLDRNETRVI